MTAAPDWTRDGADWPNREASRFIDAGGIAWHVQMMGEGPPLLLLHGTGASTHSWRDVAPILAEQFTVIIPDLPGHGFTSLPRLSQLSLDGMSAKVSALLTALRVEPALAAGHSAGAAILVRMAIDGRLAARAIAGFNAALFPMGGIAAPLFSPLAKLLVWNPLVPRLLAMSAERRSVRRLLDDSGSSIDDRGIELYRKLFASPSHVSGALGMMAAWDLDALAGDLRRLQLPLHLIASANDRFVPARDAERAARLSGRITVRPVSGLGHLAHEEEPRWAAAVIDDIWRDADETAVRGECRKVAS